MSVQIAEGESTAMEEHGHGMCGRPGAIIGPALSGLVIAYFGLGYAYLINAISYAAVLIALGLFGTAAYELAVFR